MKEPINHTTLTVVRSYEAISITLFFLGIAYIWRSRNPVYIGAYIASSVGGGVMEWIFDSKYYFRLTIDHKFIPAWEMAGEEAPVAMVLFYAFFFGIPVVLLRDNTSALHRSFGPYGTYLFVLALGCLGTPAFECTNTSIMHIYHYHQKEEYLLWGMPYSNLWFGAMMMFFPFWALEQMDILVQLIPRTNASITKQKLLGVGIGFSSVISGFFVAATINGIWYAKAGDIWTATPREF